MNKTIWNPAEHDPRVLLIRIEATKDAFTEGRRNNDMVNWFIAKRLVDLAAGEDESRSHAQMSDAYRRDFKNLMMIELTQDQRFSLTSWDEKWTTKIDRFCQAYGYLIDPARLHYLWLPMDYDDGTPEGQEAFPGIGPA
jgi:hypothetical protein